MMPYSNTAARYERLKQKGRITHEENGRTISHYKDEPCIRCVSACTHAHVKENEDRQIVCQSCGKVLR